MKPMKMVFDAEFGGRHLHAEKTVTEENMRDPFVLGLSIVSFFSDIRDKLFEQLQKIGYEVDDLR